jgi:arginine/ornithine N-succinyltransferase beta subunit
MDYYGLLWITMDYYGLLWIAMDCYGLLWITMDYYGLLWITIFYLLYSLDLVAVVWLCACKQFLESMPTAPRYTELLVSKASNIIVQAAQQLHTEVSEIMQSSFVNNS